jgi:hypothetical protein
MLALLTSTYTPVEGRRKSSTEMVNSSVEFQAAPSTRRSTLVVRSHEQDSALMRPRELVTEEIRLGSVFRLANPDRLTSRKSSAARLSALDNRS